LKASLPGQDELLVVTRLRDCARGVKLRRLVGGEAARGCA
jgi:hypothetical protein